MFILRPFLPVLAHNKPMIIERINQYFERMPLRSMLFAGLLILGVSRILTSPLPTLIIDAELIERRIATWSAQMEQTPDDDQLSLIIKQATREQVLLKEAFNRNLQDLPQVKRRIEQLTNIAMQSEYKESDLKDLMIIKEFREQALRADPVIHNFLRNSMILTLEKALPPISISVSDIAEYYRTHQLEYTYPERRSIKHVYIAKSVTDNATEISNLREQLINLTIDYPNALEASDRFYGAKFLAPKTYDEIAGIFGNQFAETTWKLPQRQWSQPVSSAFGEHLVWVEGILPLKQLSLEESSNEINAKLVDQKRNSLLHDATTQLIGSYQVIIEYPYGH
jgi:parvulin-like peptidyl-prolyl isomerase